MDKASLKKQLPFNPEKDPCFFLDPEIRPKDGEFGLWTRPNPDHSMFMISVFMP
jgi:hypothetical protein